MVHLEIQTSEYKYTVPLDVQTVFDRAKAIWGEWNMTVPPSYRNHLMFNQGLFGGGGVDFKFMFNSATSLFEPKYMTLFEQQIKPYYVSWDVFNAKYIAPRLCNEMVRKLRVYEMYRGQACFWAPVFYSPKSDIVFTRKPTSLTSVNMALEQKYVEGKKIASEWRKGILTPLGCDSLHT